ncbi:hypothetical protein HPB47_005670 [Ixodes persulcatus]|uniref:Uncharacterized protein n=1 Tax=Ixodes persulcatus TaxID=34615 RepID=A0AC60PD96_IXOPE|nr:hypothetical protein HPB47_005670 [Ixodes persulcatus]
MYVRDIFDKRKVFGEFYHLVQELRESDPEYHFMYFRMTKSSFDRLLALVYDRLVHAFTHRSPISPAERLAITLRSEVQTVMGIAPANITSTSTVE